MRIVNKSDVKEHLQELLAVQITEDMPIYEVYDDSIKMFQVLSKINNGFHINLGMIDLVMCDTVDKLIEKITLESKNVVNIVGEEQLSLIQQSYWIGREQEFYGASNSTHLYLEVHHNLDLMKLEKVIRTLIKRHGALRSIIKEEKQFIFEEKIADTFCLETINIGREEKEKYFKKLRYNNQTRLRDLENWPLFDVKNICIDTCENFLLVDIEMIIVDGMSLQLILKDFWDIYSNSKFDVQEIDYLKCAKSVRETRDKRKYEIDKEYWMQRLPLIPNAPKLPECKIWDESNICSRLQRKIEKEEWAALEKMAKDSGVTVSIVLLYAYLLTLARWSEEPQFTINVTLSSRPYTVRDIEKVVGDFTTNILFDFSASDMKGTIAEQLKFIRNKLYEYCDHSSYEGVEIIRDMIKTGKISQEKPLPIVFTSMLFGNLPNLSEMDVVYSQSQTSQVSLDNQTYKLEDGGLIVWDFIKKIYPETMVEEMFSYYCMVIEQLSKNDGELKCSPAFEKKIKLYNSTEKEIDFFNLGKRLDNIFYKFADKIAITDFEGGITYRELERNIKSTMHDLKKNGIKPGKYVVIKTDKSKESIITILAVVLAGATYVPVEKHWPVERVQYILDNAGADMIIDPYEVCSSNEVNDSWKNIDVESSTYVIYTSGSTGKPKGVEIAYKSMVNTVLDINDRIGLNSSDTILGLSSLCFDLSVYDLFATFFTGAQLKLVKELRDTEDIKKLVDSSSDIVWNSVPAAMELFIDSLDEDYKNDEMKAVLLSGDWINVNLPDKIKKHFPKAAIFSLGGATEASIWSIYYPIKKVDASWTSIPYGYPLTNQSIYILDSEQRICPPEVIGEIYIGGIGVAKGYINDEEKTSNSFVKSKYGRLYRTGDFGKYSREGYVIFCGRRDSQVKIGGYRIELEEIEAQIKEVPNIKDCIAVVNYKNQIVVFYKGEELDIAEIKRAIRKKLPTYMYPHRYYRVDDFPLNTNEKIDRKMLKSMADSGIQNKMHNEKQDDLRNPSLNKVIEIWSEVLNCDVEPENDFFELGGDSIKAQRIVRKIADNFKVKISFLTVIHSKNVAEFSKEVEKISLSFKNSKKDEATSAGSKQDNQNVFPLTGVQLAYLNGRNDNYELGKYNAHYYFEAETEYTGRLHISWDVVDELFEACIIDEIFLEFVEDIKRISENNKANSTNDFVTKVWGNILTKEIITKSVVPDLLKNIDLKQIKILDYAQELCPPDVKGQVYVSESEIMNDRNKTYYKILEHPLYGRMADTGIIGVLTHDGYMEFVVPNCETSVETPDKKEDTHEEEIEKPIVKEIMKIWKEVFEIEDISIQDDFYTLGGDSIILMRLVDEMCKTLGCDVTVDDILQSENISDLANRV